ncbi:MAG: ABC transporter permease [Acidimicrobiales bacterium]
MSRHRPPSRWAAVWAMVVADVMRTTRDRTGLFFVVVLPVVIMVIIGATFGANSGSLPMAVVVADDSPQATELLDALVATGSVTVERYDDLDDARRDVRTGAKVGVLEIPSGFGAVLSGDDGTATVVLATTDPQAGMALAEVVQASTDDLGATYAARRFAKAQTDASPEQVAAAVAQASTTVPTIAVEATSIGQAPLAGNDNQFAYTAPSNLVMFVFINSLTIGGVLIETRRLGVARRMVAAPVTIGTVLLGSGAARLVFAVGQSAVILLAGRVLFGVEWGDTMAVAAVVAAFALVGTGAGLLVGSVARTPEQAQGIGIPLAIGLAMLGGAMWPLDVVSDPLRFVGHLTPHAWAMDAWVALVFEGAGFAGVWREVLVLFGYALALLGVALVALRHRLLSGT